ncbi:hypothetical protein OG585_50705 (plasmid) [Streptomyces sp. NBC_01340]|uniref:hypothetical protein n=1 Tax=Streptomyces sp. NBC_01340 TaxID=2903830 RepID=UPI002E10555A|nr:hypothetical protein OG585_50705 [Streptomyces sp. NBC_01340]
MLGFTRVLTADGHGASLTVWDDGVGITPGGRRSGLRNMAERAEQLGGRFEVSSPEGGGTLPAWWVPLPVEEDSPSGTARTPLARSVTRRAVTPVGPVTGTGETGHSAHAVNVSVASG